MLLRHEGFRRLCEARELLREVSEPSPTIAEVAAIVRISPFHLIRRFEAVFGLTPHQFRMKARLELATDLSVVSARVTAAAVPERCQTRARQVPDTCQSGVRHVSDTCQTQHGDFPFLHETIPA